MKKTLISILIPVYNGGDYLKKTIASIQKQTLTDFEVICVDDGSKDDSYDFLCQCEKSDKRIKVIKRKEKGGDASKGISYGLPYCSGDWFFYMSQDDLISADCLENCYNKVKDTKADVCIPDTVIFTGNSCKDTVMYAPNKDYGQVMSGAEAFFLSVIYKISGFALRRMSLVKKVGQDDKFYDSCDKSMAFQYFFAKKVVFCDAQFFYRQNNPSAITKVFSVANAHHLDTCNEVIEFSIKNKIKKTHLEKMIKVFLKRRSEIVFKTLGLPEKDKTSADLILKNSLRDLRCILLKNKFFLLYVETFFVEFRKKILRGYLYNFLKNKSLTHNLLYYKLEKKLRKSGIVSVNTNNGDVNLYNAKVKSALELPCSVGKCTYVGENIYIGSPKTVIGSFCSLAANIIIGPGEHPTNYLSSSSFLYMDCLGYSVNQGNQEFLEPCYIGNDVWIGDNVFIKGGVTIGDGAVIGAGAVVTKDVPPYAIVGGVPAKIIRYRFDAEVIEELLELKWWSLSDEVIRQLPYRDIDKAISYIKNVRKNSDV